MDGQSLTTAEYWTQRHPELADEVLSDRPHNIEQLFGAIDRVLRPGEARSVFEVGCVPGRGLMKFARRYGCIPSGSDFAEQLPAVAALIQSERPGGTFVSHDIGTQDVDGLGRYDVVLSGGLIEHFEDVEAILAKHVQLLEPGGLLVLSTPNLQPVRAAYWRVFDPALLAAHNPAATDLRRVQAILERHGCRVLDAGYFGTPHVWIENAGGARGRAGGVATQLVNSALRRLPMRTAVTQPFVYWLARRVNSARNSETTLSQE
jgi:2-polyprenyl-3-methyl-5-hydroxy-6-metoxy-1,4-benzoquinol methylase